MPDLVVMGTDLPNHEPIEISLQDFKELELSRINSSVVPVVIVTPPPQQTLIFVGTAFCIASRGLWVTARHNLEGRKGADEYLENIPGSYVAILWVGSGVGEDVPELLGGVVPVRFMVRHPASGSDLALLGASRPNLEFPPLQLTARLPTEDVPILGFGYPSYEVRLDESRIIHADNNIHASSGKVLQLFEVGRETFTDLDGNFTGKLPTVCFETSARFDGGMSGGPVLGPTGAVCGVISSGFDLEHDVGQATSFVSATPYLFMLKVPYDAFMTGEQLGGRKVPIYEMVERGHVLCDASFEKLRYAEADGKTHVYFDLPEDGPRTGPST